MKSFIYVCGAALLLLTFFFPAEHWVERLVFFEDASWSLSWALIALYAFNNKKIGFPSRALPITIAVEVYLAFHYTVIEVWPYNPWLLINYVVWPLATCLNVRNYFLFEKSPQTAKFIGETLMYLVVFFFGAKRLPSELVMMYFGITVIAVISIHFLLLIVMRADLSGISLPGNLLRVLGGILCLFINIKFRPVDQYLTIVMVVIVLVDLFFLFFFYRRQVIFSSSNL